MSNPAKKDPNVSRTVAQNRKARHNYFIEDTLEVGLVLSGTEVKSLREGRGNIQESYASEMDGELFLLNAYIPEYKAGNHYNHETRRPRKILVHKRELAKLIGMASQKGYTLVPLAIFFNKRGIAKLSLGIGKGKQDHDKRASIKERDWKRDKARLMRHDT